MLLEFVRRVELIPCELKKSFPKKRSPKIKMMHDVNVMSKSEISIPLKIENNDCFMQLDTGSALSLAPLSFIKEVCPDVTLQPTKPILCLGLRTCIRP